MAEENADAGSKLAESEPQPPTDQAKNVADKSGPPPVPPGPDAATAPENAKSSTDVETILTGGTGEVVAGVFHDSIIDVALVLGDDALGAIEWTAEEVATGASRISLDSAGKASGPATVRVFTS